MTTLDKQFAESFHKHLAEIFSDNVWEEIKSFANDNTEDDESYEAMKKFLAENTTTISVG